MLSQELRAILETPILRGENTVWDTKQLIEILGTTQSACALRNMEANGGYVHICLSGGLDSTTSIALLLQNGFLSRQIFAHTIVIDLQHADAVCAKMAATHFGIKHELIVPSAKDVETMRTKLRPIRGEISFGEVGTYLLYAALANANIKSVIAHDGIDELLGGYWPHRAQKETLEVFEYFWSRLEPDHLAPLFSAANTYGVSVELPYLQKIVVEYLTRIPLSARTSRVESKIPLREIARLTGVPEAIISRPKIGFCDSLVLNEKTTTIF